MSYVIYPKVMPSVIEEGRHHDVGMPIDEVTEIVVRSSYGEWSFDPQDLSSLQILYKPIIAATAAQTEEHTHDMA